LAKVTTALTTKTISALMMTGKMNLALPSIGLPLIGEILPKSCRDVTRKRRAVQGRQFRLATISYP
jgi:hypothetical protein